MRFINKNISKAASLFYATIFLVIISATVLLSYLNTTRSLQQELIFSNTALLHQVMEKTEMILHEVDKDALNLLQEPEVRMFADGNYADSLERLQKQSDLMKKLENMMNANTHIQSAYLYSYGEKMYLSSSTSSTETAFFDKGWRDSFDQFAGYYSWLGLRSIEDKMALYPARKQVLTLVRSYPVISSPTFRKGALIINIDESMLYNLNDGVRRLGQSFILDENGQVLSHSDKQMLGQNISTKNEIIKIMNSGGAGSFEETIDGTQNLVFFASSGYTGWKYISVIPSLQLNRELLTVRNWLMLIAFVMFVVALAAVFLVNTVTYRPFESFVRSINKQLNSRKGPDSELQVKERDVNLETAEGLFDSFLLEHDHMQRQVRQNIPVMKWRLISDMLMGYRTRFIEVKPHLEWLDIQLHPAHFIVMSAEFDHKAQISSKDLPLYAYALCNVADELIHAENKGTAVEMIDGRVVIIISFEKAEQQSNMLTALTIADLIKTFVQEQFKQTITIGVGRQYELLEDLHKSYREALEALQYRLLLGANHVISIEDIEDYSRQQFYRLFDMADAVLDSVKAVDDGGVTKKLELLFQQALQESVPPKLLMQICMQLVLRSLKIGSDIGLDVESLIGGDVKLYEKIEAAENANELKRDITGYFKQLLDRIVEKRSHRGSNETVEHMLAFISKHYMRSDLSMNMIADTFQLSVPYISKIFKDYTESNFTDHLIQLRINKAKQLLEKGNAKVGNIAEQVGYSNSHSFIRIFKKVTGLTPGEYREQLILERSRTNIHGINKGNPMNNDQ
ncbi:helix-turn-helix domain-containing protein [Paenibacillus allorhizosphaerae]|uniref:HTH-type transcriptional activator RhaR n=1 Tax=Paenibacillus allorhizosphaerae TaxID=2849866 RepID=A0ABN7TWY0_9BACL|nr:helix-turn-helix domain-containing protein [Paenibacillus allorhizosphaerae]CAG7658972.1 HTH-type transcriptional activator RhaR [Paenibacillus allorhizosphaerae]